MSQADDIRSYINEFYFAPSRRQHKATVKVRAGDVHKGLALSDRMPAVCSAMKGRIILSKYSVRLREWQGPPQSSTSTATYELLPIAAPCQADLLAALSEALQTRVTSGALAAEAIEGLLHQAQEVIATAVGALSSRALVQLSDQQFGGDHALIVSELKDTLATVIGPEV